MTAVQIKVRGPISKNGQVYVNLQTDDTWANGWVDPIFTQHITESMYDLQEDGRPVAHMVEAQVVKTIYMEHINGGRTNTREYSSIEEYVTDPFVKELYLKRLTGGIIGQLSLPGESKWLDKIITLKYFGTEFTLKETSFTEPKEIAEWYSEAFQEVGKSLFEAETFENFGLALHGQDQRDDMFGQRFFPVAKFDLSKTPIEIAKDLCSAFKNSSTPIIYNGFAFIGIRAKPDEIYDIEEIYDHNGCIVKGREWDWS